MQKLLTLILCSALGHLSFMFFLNAQAKSHKITEKKQDKLIKVEINEVAKKIAVEPPKPEPKPEPKIEKKPPPPPPPKPPAKIIKKPKKVASIRKPKKTKTKPKKPVEAVQGLSKDSFVDKGTKPGFQSNAGNTLMLPDSGKRVDPSKIEELDADLSSDAILIRSSVRAPELTFDAIDAGIEGRYIVDVFVAPDGSVQDAELERKVGYGMDSLLILAAKKSRFTPRKNKDGKAISGWSTIAFRLVVP